MKINRYNLLFIIMVIFNILVSQIFAETEGYNYTLSTILVIINSIAVLYSLTKIKDRNIGVLIFFSYLIKIGLLYFDLFGRNIFVLPNSGADTEMFYHRTLKNIIFDGYTSFLHVLFVLFGNQRIIFQYCNIIFSLLAEVIVYILIDELKIKKEIKTMCMLVLCFMPNHLVISSILLRETLMILLNTISLYYFVHFLKENNTKDFIIAVLFIVFSAYFHSSVITMILPYSFYYIFYSKGENNQFDKSSFIKLFFVAIMIIALYAVFGDYVLKYFSGLDSVDKISEKMIGYIDAGSVYLEFLAYNKSVPIMIITSPIKMIYFFFSPMIWDVRGISDIIAVLGSSLFYIVIIFYHIKCNNKNKLSKAIFVILMVFGFTYGMSCFAAGTAMRHREKILAFLILLFTIDLNNNKEEDLNNEEKSIAYISE